MARMSSRSDEPDQPQQHPSLPDAAQHARKATRAPLTRALREAVLGRALRPGPQSLQKTDRYARLLSRQSPDPDWTIPPDHGDAHAITSTTPTATPTGSGRVGIHIRTTGTGSDGTLPGTPDGTGRHRGTDLRPTDPTLPLLFQPMTLRSVRIRNRIWLPPMDMYSCFAHDGVPTDFHFQHYVSRAYGGFGLIIAEATAVSPEGRISPDDTGLWNDVQVRAWSRITSAIRAAGATPAVELNHAGRRASTSSFTLRFPHRTVPASAGGWQPVGPSPLAFGSDDVPRVLTVHDLHVIERDFARAAANALRAGFQVIEIHAAHGYLLSEFLDAAVNHRTDEYGGSLENRERLLLETVRLVRRAIGPSVPLLVRLSATDWEGGEWSLQDSVHLCTRLKQTGLVDLIDVSSGQIVPHDGNPEAPGWQVPLADAIRSQADIPVSAVGGITKPSQAETVLTRQEADAVEIGRAALRRPFWPLWAASKLNVPDDKAPWPPQYLPGAWDRKLKSQKNRKS